MHHDLSKREDHERRAQRPARHAQHLHTIHIMLLFFQGLR